MSDSQTSLPRVNVLGVGISAVNIDIAAKVILGWIEARCQEYVCVTPAHGVMDCYFDPDLRSVFNASGLTTPDGMSLVWLARLMGEHQVDRVYGPDLLLRMCSAGLAAGVSHYFYGGEPGVAASLIARLEGRFPGITIAGGHSPPFHSLSSAEDREEVDRINGARPDIVWLGISTPKQERWMAGHLGRVEAPVMIGVGAAFDFISGRKAQAPRWIQRAGLEWLFRLSSEPRRLWPRYRWYPLFVILVLAQWLKLKEFPLGEYID